MIAKLKELFDTYAKGIDFSKLPDPDILSKNAETVLGIVEDGFSIFGDGIQWSDIPKLGVIVAPIMRLAAGFPEWKGEQKKEFVKEVIWIVYRTIDTFPDGKRNNINIPFVFGALEVRLERWIINFAADMAIDAVFPKLREDKEV